MKHLVLTGNAVKSIDYGVKNYLAVMRDGDDSHAEMVTHRWVLDYLDMADCFEYDEIHVYDVSQIGKIVELNLHGTWHDFDNPLYMKATYPDGSIAFDGWGTDH